MAESLRRLNQAHDNRVARTSTPSHTQQSEPAQEDDRSEIYHSLEDAVPISEAPATPAPLASLPLLLPLNSAGEASAPISGQVCR
jgi:hypothetical protein